MIKDTRKIAKLARESNLHHNDYVESYERKLKTDAKLASNRKLYLDGYRKGLQGIPFESFTDLIEYNGEKIQRKNHPGFEAGYIKGLNDLAKIENNNNNNNNKTR